MAAHLVDHVIRPVPIRQWVLSLPISLRLLLAAQPRLVTPALQVVHRAITRFLLDQARLKAEQADSGAVTLIQRFGSAANLNIHLHCLMLDGVYRCNPEREPVFVQVPAPTDEALQTVLHQIHLGAVARVVLADLRVHRARVDSVRARGFGRRRRCSFVGASVFLRRGRELRPHPALQK